MKTITISKGSYLDTPYGYLEIKSRNDGGLIYCDAYDVNGEDCEQDCIFVGEERHTLEELSNLATAVTCGRPRIKVEWADEIEDDEDWIVE